MDHTCPVYFNIHTVIPLQDLTFNPRIGMTTTVVYEWNILTTAYCASYSTVYTSVSAGLYILFCEYMLGIFCDIKSYSEV